MMAQTAPKDVSHTLKTQLEAALKKPAFQLRERVAPQTIPTGISQVDQQYGGIPRGAITEIVGAASSGRTTLLYSLLAEATRRGEVCALVDASDAFDPESAAAAGMDLRRMLWVRCGSNKKGTTAVTDLLLQNGGWGVIALDLADIDPKEARRIPLNVWHRYRLAIENKPTAFLVMGQQTYTASCSALVLDTWKTKARWNNRLFSGAYFEAARRKPPAHATACFDANALPQEYLPGRCLTMVHA